VCHVDPAVGLARPAKNHLSLVHVTGVEISKKGEHLGASFEGAEWLHFGVFPAVETMPPNSEQVDNPARFTGLFFLTES
jgi:hypothetical protein